MVNGLVQRAVVSFNCRTMLENGIEYYNMDVAVFGLPVLVAECLADDEAC